MNIVDYGTPINNYIEGWSGQYAKVLTDEITQVKYYYLQPDGFLQQAKSLFKQLVKIDVSCMYKGTGRLVFTVIGNDDTFDIICNCSVATEWTKVELTVPIDMYIKSIDIKAYGIKQFNITHIYGVVQFNASDGMVTAENFMDKAILYGKDKDKPNLREVTA